MLVTLPLASIVAVPCAVVPPAGGASKVTPGAVVYLPFVEALLTVTALTAFPTLATEFLRSSSSDLITESVPP